MHKQRKLVGLTLIEILVMLTIAMILTLIAIPNFSGLLRRHRVTSQAEELYATIQFARSEAVKTNSTIYLSVVSGDSWCYGLNANSACNCQTANSCSLLTKAAPAAQQTSLSSTGLISNSIQFEATHGAANNSGTITFTAYGNSELITLSVGRLGNVSFCSTGISGYQGC